MSPGCVLQLRAMKDISGELVVAGITCSFVNKTEHVLSTSAVMLLSCGRNSSYVPPPVLERCISFRLFLAL